MSEEYEQGEEIEIEAIGIEVSSHPIELYKVFKIANLVGGGGEAKHLIAEGYVAVNGELETRKRRKMYDGDFFEFNQEYYVVVCDAPITEPEPKVEPKAPQSKAKGPANSKQKSSSSKAKKTSNKKKSKQSSDAKPKSSAPRNKNGRTSIDFF
ncbi:RNA-binding S4 domain-containing protein [Vibrio atypicus]|uniref:RNA-binding S4 domain-containing protein n=1 Tax=Vibrio atypicus TaxID=558271 RepID=UPI003736EC13